MNLKKGISAIIPTYKGEKFITKLLDSIKNQTLSTDLFEVIFIINGELDSTPKILEEFKVNNPNIDIKIEYSDKGVCNARNIGIEKISKEYTIFIDDDDFISEKYFEILLKYAKEDRIVIGTFLDVDEESSEIKESYLSSPLLKRSGIVENPYTLEYQGILTITTDKLIPTKYVKKSSFNPNLKNGVDIGYYSIFYANYDFEFYVVDKTEEAIYYRLWRDQSISRKSLSYEFNVLDRLKVINDINKGLKIAKTSEKANFIKTFTGGQVFKINQYLDKHPEDLKKVLRDIAKYNFEFFPYKYLNEKERLDEENNELIISYTFPPTNTTTSNTLAKRILKNKKNVDVICATTPSLNKDYELKKLVDEFLIEKFEIDLDFSMDWQNMKAFAYEGILNLNKNYDTIYSRAYFPHSHFLALEYKLKHPETYWKAEFSDPLIYDFEKRELSGPINDLDYVKRINKLIKDDFKQIKVEDSVHFICEYLTYIFADELIFTNENQLEVTKDLFPYEFNFKNKITIDPHPTLDEKYYYIKENDYKLDDNFVNFGYFGVINSNRCLEDFIEGIDLLDEKFKDKYKLHLFTPNKNFFEQCLSKNILKNTIINPVASYLDFLNLSTKFDVLLVEDSLMGGAYIKNPFLPSKISDYKGSNTDIWAICDEDSIMSKIDVKYKSKLNDLNSNREIANKIMSDKLDKPLKTDNNYSLEENNLYLKKRISHLATKVGELVDVAEAEFKKDEEYLTQINALEAELNQMKNSNSWKLTKNFRKIGKRFK